MIVSKRRLRQRHDPANPPPCKGAFPRIELNPHPRITAKHPAGMSKSPKKNTHINLG